MFFCDINSAGSSGPIIDEEAPALSALLKAAVGQEVVLGGPLDLGRGRIGHQHRNGYCAKERTPQHKGEIHNGSDGGLQEYSVGE